ncbi:MAG: DUF3299 domain-containing protein [Gemmatimonadota bacterium]
MPVTTPSIRAERRSRGSVYSFGIAVLVVWSTPWSTEPVESANRMVAAAEDPTEIDWRTLRDLDYRTGERSEELAALDGQEVRIAGFTVPFEDWMTTATEFLLVPYAGACVHTPPPPPHQLVFVEMDRSRRASLAGMDAPMWIEGVLHIEETENIYGQAGFRIVAKRVYPYAY